MQAGRSFLSFNPIPGRRRSMDDSLSLSSRAETPARCLRGETTLDHTERQLRGSARRNVATSRDTITVKRRTEARASKRSTFLNSK
jgi:hypothetical protein